MSDEKETAAEKEERLYKEYEVLWKKFVQSDLDKHKNFTSRVFSLVELLNSFEPMKVGLVETPGLKFGPYTPTPRMVEVYMIYNLPKAVGQVPDEVRSAFLDLVMKVDKDFPVFEIKIGFRPHIGPPINNIVDPLLPDKCVHNCPMLKICVAI